MFTDKNEDVVADDLFYCFVNLENNDEEINFRFFVIPSKLVSKYLKESFQYWLDNKSTRDKNNKVRVFLLGEQGKLYPKEFKTLLQKDYENNWDLLK